MKYYRYFELFLNIEDQLCDYITQLEYSDKSKHLFSPKISLLLLQTCPIIESYMVHLCTKSTKVINHPLYSWEYNKKIWDIKYKNKEKTEETKRSINKFPKFAYVTEKVFSLSDKKCIFYYSDKFQYLDGNSHCMSLLPYKSLIKFIDYKGYSPKTNANNQFPSGLDTPKWWNAYNKIKHDLDEAEEKVTYHTAIEAISALFVLLCYAEPDTLILKNNDYCNENNEIRTKLFSCNLT